MSSGLDVWMSGEELSSGRGEELSSGQDVYWSGCLQVWGWN